jgi:hypothetical protein
MDHDHAILENICRDAFHHLADDGAHAKALDRADDGGVGLVVQLAAEDRGVADGIPGFTDVEDGGIGMLDDGEARSHGKLPRDPGRGRAAARSAGRRGVRPDGQAAYPMSGITAPRWPRSIVFHHAG